ncbi:hypothetical protein SeMB42_g04155 [Synchytrium endobioticum]|uniref:RNA methyltransferase n=1 Tax=Synchytrium endobioticum TaxID=286115 RepID=A0A507D2I7_9FUNG|nr:hypothetical protein SeMB42_g04155 [Synchytrium endobioticum]TPX45683.1 hypothetical protein SeLEV6574_g03730 [Synchytrium endobioticum]
MNPYLAHLSSAPKRSSKFDRPHKRFGTRPTPYLVSTSTAHGIEPDEGSAPIADDVITTPIPSKSETRLHQPHPSTNPVLPRNAYGNYHKYYASRNPAMLYDPRLSLLTPSWFENKRVLDIGCNSGHVTIMLACLFGPRDIQGVDIDIALIRAANEGVRYRASVGKNVGRNLKRKIPASVCSGTYDLDYFPLSAPAMLGLAPVDCNHGSKCSDATGVDHFPDNIHFRASDWLVEPPSAHQYDCILALSLTKWIHLHHGDEGLLALFTKVYSALSPNGRFILEPQPFDVYREGNLSSAMKENLKTIIMKPERFSDVLVKEIGFRKCSELVSACNETCSKDAGDGATRHEFRRPIYVFVK